VVNSSLHPDSERRDRDRGAGRHRQRRPIASADATDAIMRSVREFGQRILVAAWVDRAVTRLGVDETAFLAATARAHTQFTGLADLAPAGGGPPGPAARRRWPLFPTSTSTSLLGRL